MSAEPQSHENDECRILRALNSTPDILVQIAASTGSELGLQTDLRRRFPDDLVRVAMSLHELRRKATTKFARADEMWFDRQGLEQSTAEAVSRYKALRFEGPVWDLCCGIGSDAISLASRGDVTAVDINPASCLRTEWNAAAYGVNHRLQTNCLDVRELTNVNGLVHIDPDRRPGSAGRVSRIEDCSGPRVLARPDETVPRGSDQGQPGK